MRKPILALLIAIAVAAVGCGGGPSLPPATEGGGWILETLVIDSGIVSTAPGVTVRGEWQKDLIGAAGDPSTFTVVTNVLGLAALGSARAPATWKVTWLSGGGQGNLCDGQSSTDDIALNSIELFVCTIFRFGTGASVSTSASASAFSFLPNPLDISAPPGTVTITGQGFTAQYGMPLVRYFDLSGNLLGQSNAQSVAPDGTWIQAPTQDVSSLPSGTYVGFLYDANASGGWDFLGTVPVTVVAPTPPPPPPPDDGCNPCLIQ